ncbi:universal stress protein [Dyella humicola]|uniref:universal stress protein n=1 Tax=Dyella humicola TaxID=2992126 RepID=UPI00224CD114|nr:universal stress protein [Dyella humicola]
MYKHILLPIDGSELSLRAARAGIELARICQAPVYALHVVAPLQSIAYMGAILAATEFAYNEEAKTHAERYLADVRALAEAAGVLFDGQVAFGGQPAETIVQTAKDKRCDLVVMASHGWRGMTRLLLGSETQKVLLSTEVPVLVYH